MLAYKVDSKPVDWTKKVYMQPKLDGVRCVIQLNDKGEVYAYSRTLVVHNMIYLKIRSSLRSHALAFFGFAPALARVVCCAHAREQQG